MIQHFNIKRQEREGERVDGARLTQRAGASDEIVARFVAFEQGFDASLQPSGQPT